MTDIICFCQELVIVLLFPYTVNDYYEDQKGKIEQTSNNVVERTRTKPTRHP